jgi:uncharacterized membrane protein
VASRELISASRLAWIRGEITAWRNAGLVNPASAEQIEARCATSLRARGARTVLLIGAALLASGIIGVVASNLEVDEIGPFARSLLIALVWLALVALAEAVRRRGALAVLANPVALLAAVAYGATIFQVSQSLQVPAFEPSLILAWAIGALVYAYATRDSAPLVLGVGALVAWYVWELADRADVVSALVLGLALAMPLATALAAFHEGTGMAHFTGAWRVAAALLGLGALAVAAESALQDRLPSVPGFTLTAAIPIAAISLAAIVRGDRRQRIEVVAALAIAAAAVALVATASSSREEVLFGEDLTGSALTHSLVAVGLFLALATAIASVGAASGGIALTVIGVGAIVLFFAGQAFAFVFLSIGSSAWLLLGLGALLIACGLLADVLQRRAART